ncbi:MAG: terpene cyclase/mutase family protein [Planctomycetales bacterium]|nr:terpene cyclase/mutase family protein [Planctomycetales bacterium]
MGLVSPVLGQVENAAGNAVVSTADHRAAVARAIEFLRTRQNPDGSYSPESGPGLTALVTTALLKHGHSVEEPQVANSLKYLQGLVQPEGGIHAPESKYRNYETCLAVMCFAEANRDGRYTELLQLADTFLKSIQWDQGEGLESSDPGFGGAGYGSHKRPDLSNTTFLIEALRALGNDADSEAVQRALVFVSRCQNLPSSHNETEFAGKVQDGGFYYTPAAGGNSQAGSNPDGGLRSYASMTYAGLKSMIFAGVDSEDPRVAAAVKWLGEHYDLKSNPGMGDSGLFYYYHTFAKALAARGEAAFVDSQGVKHDWRGELNRELLSRQLPNGSWVNENQRWLESNPDLVTGYALLALAYTRP